MRNPPFSQSPCAPPSPYTSTQPLWPQAQLGEPAEQHWHLLGGTAGGRVNFAPVSLPYIAQEQESSTKTLLGEEMLLAMRGRATAASLTFRNQTENVSLFCITWTLTSSVPGFQSSGLLLILLSSHVTNSDRLLRGLHRTLQTCSQCCLLPSCCAS